MNLNNIISFFDKVSAKWDEEMIRDDDIISSILDNANVFSGVKVLDVACGTGVLFPDYLYRNVDFITAIDISPKMIEICKNKFNENKNIKLICGDALDFDFNEKFDVIMIYNAFPHFASPEDVIEKLSKLLNKDGILSVAHGMSKKQIDEIHKHSASEVSVGLMEADDLEKIISKYLKVEVKISDDKMYQLCGKNCQT